MSDNTTYQVVDCRTHEAKIEGRLVALEAIAKVHAKELGRLAARVDPPPAPPISRERMAGHLSELIPFDMALSDLLALADRAIELLAGRDLESAKLGNDLVGILADHVGKTGLSESAVEVLQRLIRERDESRAERDIWKEDFERATVQVNALEGELRCPKCGCATQADAERNECGCDAPVCSRNAASTLAQEFDRLAAELREAREAPPPAIDVERLGPQDVMRIIWAAFDRQGMRPLPGHWRDCSERKRLAFTEIADRLGATALPPIPEGDAGPKALREATKLKRPWMRSWEQLQETEKAALRVGWNAAVALLRPDAATGKGGGE